MGGRCAATQPSGSLNRSWPASKLRSNVAAAAYPHEGCAAFPAFCQQGDRANLGIQCARVARLLHAEDALDPCHHLVRGGVGGFVQVDHAIAHILLHSRHEQGAAAGSARVRSSRAAAELPTKCQVEILAHKCTMSLLLPAPAAVGAAGCGQRGWACSGRSEH